MKHHRKHKLHLPLAFLLSLILIFEGMSVAVLATEPADTTVGTEMDTDVLAPDLPDMEGDEIESDVITSPPSIAIDGDTEITPKATRILVDGIYAFRNIGNLELYIDTQYDASSPGYKLQQYAYGTSPTQTLKDGGYANGGLFKLSYRADLDSYVVRSMTNNLLSYKYSNGYFITHEIPADDADVAAEDTFKFVCVSGTTYNIHPYGEDTYCIASQSTTASGSAGAPDSYLIRSTVAASGDQAGWRPVRYN